MKILENKDIKLRALEPSDIEILYKWENDEDSWEVSNTNTPFSRYILQKYLDNAYRDIYENKELRLVIASKETDEAVGLIDLFDFDPFHSRAGVGILVAEQKHRRLGYGKQALECLINYSFGLLKIHLLYCNISASNKSSISLFSSLGFEKAGIKKDWSRTMYGREDEYYFQIISL
ncbi:MAG: GNAT family N-acetyltransferase [Marinifilaceae bacterium]